MAGSSRRGFFGTFLMGLTVGVVAAPCIGPFILGLLTYVGDRGNVLLGFWLFFLLALGLGAPFVALAFFSGSLSRLPRSGGWMVWVRKIFGFVLLAMAVYFLKTLFADPLLYSLLLAMLLFVAGIYLAWIEPTKAGGKAFPFLRVLIGAAFFAAALFTAASGIDRAIDKRVSEAASRTGGVSDTGAIAWIPYTEDALRAAAAAGRPAFIDFYADWCIPCQENDDKTFSDAEVAALSREFVMLKADMTSSSDPRTKRLEKQYDLPGMPTLIFIGPDGRELRDLRRAGFVDKRSFLALMNKALDGR
jgi:thiol:disulfide interchange protein DsbD